MESKPRVATGVSATWDTHSVESAASFHGNKGPAANRELWWCFPPRLRAVLAQSPQVKTRSFQFKKEQCVRKLARTFLEIFKDPIEISAALLAVYYL